MRRTTILLMAVLAAAASLVGLGSPASAAPSITLGAGSIDYAVVGQPFQISWEASSDLRTVVASGNGWATPGTLPLKGSQTITPTTTDDLTFTLTGDPGGQDFTATVTVEVRATGAVRAVAPTFPEPCTVLIPQVEGVDYVYDTTPGDDEVDVLPSGPVPLALLASEGVTEIQAEAADGYVLDQASPTTFALPSADDCELEPAAVPDDLVRTASTCRTVTFTNIADEALLVDYGVPQDGGEGIDDGELELPVGASRTVTTKRAVLSFVAGTPSAVDPSLDDPDDAVLPRFDFGNVLVRQTCSDHPTVAPAAGR